MTNHPIQPLEDVEGVLRFKKNLLVCHLLKHGGISLNDLVHVEAPQEDHVQLAQLIGYSFSGFATLSYVNDEDYAAVEETSSTGVSELEARNQVLRNKLGALKDMLERGLPELIRSLELELDI